MWLTRLALRNPIFILMVSLAILALGWVSLTRLSVDLFPAIDVPIIRVTTSYTGAGPADVEKSITIPIERAVSSAPGIDRVESNSRQGYSSVSAWFQYGSNLDNAQFEIQQRVAHILSQLPSGIQQPSIIKMDLSNTPVVQVAMTSDDLDQKQLYDLAINTVQPQIERVVGVASASANGGRTREIQVMVQRDALRARNLGILDVVNAVKTSNLLLPSGNLRAGDRDYNVFSNTQFGEARPLRDVIVRPAGRSAAGDAATPIRISDVAKVVDGTEDQSLIVRINGKLGVTFQVLKQPGANTVAVVDSIREALPELRGVPPHVKLAVSFDQSTYIRAAIKSLQHEAVQGGLLAVVVVLLFLVSFSATGIVAVAIPLSIVATFVLLYFTGQTLNVFTLGGLALGVGRLVDDSIVELENIHRHLAMGKNRREAVLDAAQEVAMPIFVSTVTTIVVFFPVVFLVGVQKLLFMPLALTIAFALIMSFLVSMTVTPLLCLKYLHAERHRPDSPGIRGLVSRWLQRLDDSYARSLRWVLGNRWKVIAGIGAVFGASLLLPFTKQIGTEFFPTTDESQFQISFKTPVGTRVERTELVAKRIEEILEKTLASFRAADGGSIISRRLSSSGLPSGRGGGFGNSGPHAGGLHVNLVSHTDRPITDVEAADAVRKVLREALPGVQIYLSTGGLVKRILNFGSGAPIDVEISGYDLEVAASYAKLLQSRLREVLDRSGRPLLTDVQISREENYPELDVTVDREKAGTLGITEQEVAQSVLASLVGSSQFQSIPFTDGKTGNQYAINVRLDDRFRSDVSDLLEVYVRSPSGRVVSLANLATVKRSSGPVLIQRKYLQRIVDVTANVAVGSDLGSASEAVQKVLQDTPPPDGFTARLGGQTAAQKEAFSGLWLAVVLAIALVYMILASQFRSLVDPLVIMISVPLGITGVFFSLWLTNTTLSVNSFMGTIMMVGIVVSNGVLLVDFARVLQSRGKPLFEATIEAGRTRLRPILMTTIATVVGLAPMALGFGEGSETNLPLARAVIGGLTVSTIFTLFLIPALYTLLERFSRRESADSSEAERAT